MGFFLKRADAEIDYAVDWAAGYLDGETVVSSDWSVDPVEEDGVVVGATVTGPGAVAATLTGGVPGHVYRVTNRAAFSDGRSDARGLTVRIEEW